VEVVAILLLRRGHAEGGEGPREHSLLGIVARAEGNVMYAPGARAVGGRSLGEAKVDIAAKSRATRHCVALNAANRPLELQPKAVGKAPHRGIAVRENRVHTVETTDGMFGRQRAVSGRLATGRDAEHEFQAHSVWSRKGSRRAPKRACNSPCGTP
jgi:hypothetical protein